jgi:hypothetical protein
LQQRPQVFLHIPEPVTPLQALGKAIASLEPLFKPRDNLQYAECDAQLCNRIDFSGDVSENGHEQLSSCIVTADKHQVLDDLQRSFGGCLTPTDSRTSIADYHAAYKKARLSSRCFKHSTYVLVRSSSFEVCLHSLLHS